MRLSTTISVYAGGQGSGCHGENCGRPPAGKTAGGLDHDAKNVKEGKLTPSQKKQLDKEYKYQKNWPNPGMTVERHGNMVVTKRSDSTRTAWIDNKGKFQVTIVPDRDRPEAVKKAGEDNARITKEFKDATKKLGLPSGGDKSTGYYRWSKSGGYAGEKVLARVEQAAKKAGFKQQVSDQFLSPDGYTSRNGNTWTKGNVSVELSAHYGATKSSNSYSVTVRHKDAK